ncbi:TonB-dependent receptor plug domain-containing protein [Denitromonas iodatirespirans]|uniref:TonB-dependent receptor n=1 Tax=Denitromonas iodatirespirans TaxID=2795389 RepID=A0A944DLQ9_DENI1|nr:TonB-dependent receptor [Denitromonas iodatirespirans]MBT0960994.1 TonB-dependent receptor [Denitromonas iodatirespirans]
MIFNHQNLRHELFSNHSLERFAHPDGMARRPFQKDSMVPHCPASRHGAAPGGGLSALCPISPALSTQAGVPGTGLTNGLCACRQYSDNTGNPFSCPVSRPPDSGNHIAPSAMPNRTVLWLTVLCLAAATATSRAAPDAVSTEMSFLDDIPVVLSAARLIQPLKDAPGAATVIDRAMIRASGARNLAELLAWVPGFQLGHKNGATALTTYHGLSDDAPRRMLVRVDGRSAYSPYFISGIEWAKISVDIDDIDRIEVFRGSNAAAYGSNAFLGVVNIITRPAADTPRFRLRITEGENGIQERVLSTRQQAGNVSARLTVGRQGDNGLELLGDTYRNQRVDARIDWQLAPDQELEFHLGFVDSRARTGLSNDVTDPARSIDSYSGFGQLRWRKQLGLGDEIKATYFHQEERAVDAFFVPIGGGNGVQVDYGNRALRDDLEFEHLRHPRSDLRLAWGAGWREDRVSSEQIFATDENIVVRQARLFANTEWQATPEWTFNAGAMLEKTNETGPRLSPRLAANFHVLPDTTLRAAFSRAYRNLTPFERYADVRFTTVTGGVLLRQSFQPSPGLKPERVTTREVGVRQEWRGGRSSVDLRLFDERVEDMLRRVTAPSNVTPAPALNNNGETPRYFNGGYARIRGAELSGLYRPTHDTWVGGHYASLDINSNDEFADRSAPNEQFSVFAAAEVSPGWHMSVSHHFVGSMQWYTQDKHRLKAYRRTDLRLARRIAAGGVRGELAVGVERFTDEVSDYLPTLTRPTQAYVTLRVEY